MDLFLFIYVVVRNRKYETVKALLELGRIKTFEEFAAHMPYSTIARDAGISGNRMKRLLQGNPGDLTLSELITICKVLKIRRHLLEELVIREIEKPVAKKLL